METAPVDKNEPCENVNADEIEPRSVDDYDTEDETEAEEEDVWHEVPVVPEKPVMVFGREVNAVLFEMCMGLLAYAVICQAVIPWFTPNALSFSLGLWLGIITAYAYLFHIWWSIGRYIYMGAAAAIMARKQMALRYLVIIVILVTTAIIATLLFLGTALGLFGIKTAALMQPLVRKLRTRNEVAAPEANEMT
ncbi:MAG: hypothetical protein LBC96_08055 [Lachnospiraceae bacterium]|jgi:hypothetical protein|nr:hypothetical protein [Lachnospiraceae bacterium]